MKGNEARVVFFLHPVNQFKDGEVAEVKKSLWGFFGFRSLLLLLGLLLGLGVLVYVLLQFGFQTRSQQEPVSTREVPFDTTTESPVTARIANVTSNQTRGNDSSTENIPPGVT